MEGEKPFYQGSIFVLSLALFFFLLLGNVMEVTMMVVCVGGFVDALMRFVWRSFGVGWAFWVVTSVEMA